MSWSLVQTSVELVALQLLIQVVLIDISVLFSSWRFKIVHHCFLPLSYSVVLLLLPPPPPVVVEAAVAAAAMITMMMVT
jgi:hypothetical protein